MPLTEAQYIPNGRTIVNALAFDDTGETVITRDINGRILFVGNLTTTPVEILAWDPITNNLVLNGLGGTLLIGTSVTSGSQVGDIVLPYGAYYRQANQAGTAALGLVGISTLAGTPNVANIAPTTILTVGQPPTVSGATVG